MTVPLARAPRLGAAGSRSLPRGRLAGGPPVAVTRPGVPSVSRPTWGATLSGYKSIPDATPQNGRKPRDGTSARGVGFPMGAA